MCRCDHEGPPNDDARLIEQAEDEMVLAEQVAERTEQQLVQAMQVGIGIVLGSRGTTIQDRTVAETQRYLDTMAFAVGVLMEHRFAGEPRHATEHAQRMDLIHAKQVKQGRACWPDERELILQVSAAIWAVRGDPALPSLAGWTARTARTVAA